VNTQVRERVYTFPDSISLGLIDTASLKSKPEQATYLSRSVMVYQRTGTDFQIAAKIDLPFLRITKRQAHLKDRFEVQVEVIPEKLKAGPINSSSNHNERREFPELEVAVLAVNATW
jgi:hypothetical protein